MIGLPREPDTAAVTLCDTWRPFGRESDRNHVIGVVTTVGRMGWSWRGPGAGVACGWRGLRLVWPSVGMACGWCGWSWPLLVEILVHEILVRVGGFHGREAVLDEPPVAEVAARPDPEAERRDQDEGDDRRPDPDLAR